MKKFGFYVLPAGWRYIKGLKTHKFNAHKKPSHIYMKLLFKLCEADKNY